MPQSNTKLNLNLEDNLTLSWYKEIIALDEQHTIFLVLDTRSNRVFIKKISEVYNKSVFTYLKENPVFGMPQIFEVIETNDKLITIESYIQGITLSNYLKNTGNLTEKETAEFSCELCKIVLGLHSLNPPIIHRDIKPDNIMITEDGILKLIDINAAKWSNPDETKDTVLIGTHGFAAPEQYGFAPSNEKTDIYAIGSVMNIMLTGVLPGEKISDGNLKPIIEKCTKIDPESRYSNVEEILKDLENLFHLINEKEPESDKIQPSMKVSSEQNSPYAQNPSSVESSSSRQDDNSSHKSYALPGFRSKNPVTMIFATFIYIFGILGTLFADVTSINNTSLWITRILMFIAFIACVFLVGDYQGAQKFLNIRNIKNIFLKTIAIAISCFVIFISSIIVSAMIESVLW